MGGGIADGMNKSRRPCLAGIYSGSKGRYGRSRRTSVGSYGAFGSRRATCYIEPGSYEIYKKTGEFPEGTIFFKELQLTLPAENPDGSRTEPSGRGFFPGKLNGADVTVKDSKRYADTGG